MPRGIPKNPNARIKRHYFLVSGEIEYTSPSNFIKGYTKVNGIHVAVGQRLTVKDLGNVQKLLQMHFFNKYSKSNTDVPEITDAIINSISYLGSFTQNEFHNDEELNKEEKPKEEKKTEEKQTELKVVSPETPVDPAAVEPAAVKVDEPKPETMAVTPEPVAQPLVEVLPAPVEPKVEEKIAPPATEALKVPEQTLVDVKKEEVQDEIKSA